MLNRKHDQDTEPFPSQCEVRGCTSAPTDRFPAGGAVATVCERHELELRAGEPHAVDGGELLVGRDCTGELLGVRVTRTPTSETAVLHLGHNGTTYQQVALSGTKDLRSAVDALGVDGGDADPTSGHGS